MIIVIVETDLADCYRPRLITTRNDPIRNILIPSTRFVRMNTLSTPYLLVLRGQVSNGLEIVGRYGNRNNSLDAVVCRCV